MLRSVPVAIAMLGALQHSLATPARGYLTSRAEEATAWPKFLGPSDPPYYKDVDTAYQTYLDNRGEVTSPTDWNRIVVSGSAWWAAVFDLTKLRPDGKWIKSMFQNWDEEKKTVDVILYKDHKPVRLTVSADDAKIPKEGEARWPMLLELAAFSAFSETGSPYYLGEPDTALELLTGNKAVKIEPKNKEEAAAAVKDADFNPTITQVRSETGINWAGVLSANDTHYDSVSYNGKRKYQDVRDYSNILEPLIYSTVYKLEDFQGFTERPGGEPSVVTTIDRDVYLSTRSLIAASTDATNDGATQVSSTVATTGTT